MEIGDRCPTALDQSYNLYATFVAKTYGIEAAPFESWVRIQRGMSANSRAQLGFVLVSASKSRTRQNCRLCDSLVADGIGRRFGLMLEPLYLAEKVVDLLHKSKEPLRVLLFPGERA